MWSFGWELCAVHKCALGSRGHIGTYHNVHEDHLDRYLDEQTYRFNTRDMGDGERFANTLGRVDGLARGEGADRPQSL